MNPITILTLATQIVNGGAALVKAVRAFIAAWRANDEEAAANIIREKKREEAAHNAADASARAASRKGGPNG